MSKLYFTSLDSSFVCQRSSCRSIVIYLASATFLLYFCPFSASLQHAVGERIAFISVQDVHLLLSQRPQPVATAVSLPAEQRNGGHSKLIWRKKKTKTRGTHVVVSVSNVQGKGDKNSPRNFRFHRKINKSDKSVNRVKRSTCNF